MSEQSANSARKAPGRRFAGALAVVMASASVVWAQPQWKTAIEFPNEPYRVVGYTAANPDWVKFTIKVAEPDTVYYQDSNLYTFHYDFVTAVLPPYIGITPTEFERIALHEAGQELILGAVLMPASGTYPPPGIPEYGIQFIRQEAYPREQIVALFNLVKNTVIAEPNVQAFYFPTFEQWPVAQQNAEWFAEQGVIVSSPSRWADGNAVYSEGWALGQVKFFEGGEIAQAYISGQLLPVDILLTDGVPSEVPFLAGIMTLTPSTPNSHVAILAQGYGIPFVHLALPEDAELAQSLIGHRIVLRAYEDYWGSETRLIDVEGVLSDEQIEEILQLKAPPPLDIRPMRPYGAFSHNAGELVLEDICFFGGKAANYGLIRRAIPDYSPRAMGLSFDVWNEFMEQTMPGGGTLREEIAAILAQYPTWPPADMGALANDLATIRSRITNDTVFSPALMQAVKDSLRDPQYGFNPDRKIRFRSSSNMEDSEHFTGAGLYDSYSGCLADELDGDAAWNFSAWPCAAALGRNDVYAWSLSSVGDLQNSYASADGDVGNPGAFIQAACPTGACCIEGACTETSHSECVGTHGGTYMGNGTTCASTVCAQPGDGRLRITEYLYAGYGGEFIEFTNIGTEPIDMTGWSYDDTAGVPGTVDLSAFGVVEPGESVILTEDSAGVFADRWGCAGVAIIGGLTTNLGRNDEINLFNQLGQLVDRLTYGDEAFPGSIRTRYFSGWPCDVSVGANNIYGWGLSFVGDAQDSYVSTAGDVGSPGRFVTDPCPTGACCVQGVCLETTRGDCLGVHGGLYQGDGTSCDTVTCPQPSGGQMRITEYMSMGGGGEFIEFTNLGTQPVDMTGWSYDDESGVPGAVELSDFGEVAAGESVILAEDPAERFASSWGLSGVRIIGDLTVNLGRSDAIHLYDASGVLVDRLSYQENEGPSQCDPTESEERGVFRAIRKVIASFYNQHAFLERLRYGVDPIDVGMAMLVHHSFPDEIELANGVATFERISPTTAEVRFVSQLGAVSVTNPEGGAIPEEVRVYLYGTFSWAEVIRHSSLVQLGGTVMEFEDDYLALAGLMRTVANDYAAAIGEARFLLDFEYKKLAPGGAALPAGGLEVDQVRRIPAPDTTPSITPFLINVPEEYVTFQGEFGDVFANHRLKSEWRLATQSLWMDEEHLASSFYTDAWLEYTEGCWPRQFAGRLPEFPEFRHEYEGEFTRTLDGWKFGFLTNPRKYNLITPYVRTLVSKAEPPVLTLSDLGMPQVTVTYEEPVLTWDWEGPTWTLSETIQLTPPPQPQPSDILQDRLFTDEETGVEIHSQFYWPAAPSGPVIWTAPLSRWVETTITGLTRDPIVLHGEYSQTYRPGHHNITEFFIFEPRLEPGISQQILNELTRMGIQYVYVVGSPYPGGNVQMYFYDDINCAEIRCSDNEDCGFTAYRHYCRKAWGDCDGEGVCTPVPRACIDLWDPVCGCDGITYSNACYAAMAGVNVAYDGPCATPCSENADCPDDSHYCAKAVGDCDGEGVCTLRPTGCPDVWDPVCGCDGRTYGNDCEAAAAGVNVARWGPCSHPCLSSAECRAANEYCYTPPGHCGEEGECLPRPAACLDVWDPVCGCDGRTYSNACYAAMAGVSVAYEGECGVPCKSGLDCPKSQYCAKAVGDCDGEGICRPRPAACIDLWDPVCGCDGRTYSNACYAAMAGVSVKYQGPCGMPTSEEP